MNSRSSALIKLTHTLALDMLGWAPIAVMFGSRELSHAMGRLMARSRGFWVFTSTLRGQWMSLVLMHMLSQSNTTEWDIFVGIFCHSHFYTRTIELF